MADFEKKQHCTCKGLEHTFVVARAWTVVDVATNVYVHLSHYSLRPTVLPHHVQP